MGIEITSRRRRTFAAAALGALLVLTACESATVDRTNAVRAEVPVAGLSTSDHLTAAARGHSAQMCAEGAVSSSPDPATTSGDEPATAVAELVGSAPLDPAIADWGQRNGDAANQIWDAWRDDPTLVDPQWESIGVGEVECGDGNLYSTLVLRNDLPGIGEPGDTTQIQLVSQTTTGGWRYRFFRNLAYGCSTSGYQTFVVGTKVGSDPAATKPLWVKMHGGGVGYYNAAGTPIPASHKSEESRAALLNNVDDGLMADAMAAPEGFRVVVVSMCSHDAYAGANTFDANNPNLLPDGTPRTTNGLLATKAAIEHAMAAYPTDGLFLQGGSAGSAGSFHVAWGLQEQGLAPAGVVADSGIPNYLWELDQIQQALPCSRAGEGANLITARWHPTFADPDNQADLAVADGRLTVPLMHIWNSNDPNVCGASPMACTQRDGSVITMPSADCVHEPMREAIAAEGPSSRSANLRVCVDDPARVGDCDKHVVTNRPLVNTDPAAPADYNAFVLDWVRDRLADDRAGVDIGA
jgi:hypothetical protein